jgi:hypothetical protein
MHDSGFNDYVSTLATSTPSVPLIKEQNCFLFFCKKRKARGEVCILTKLSLPRSSPPIKQLISQF